MGKQWKQCQTLFWGGSKITVDGDCSHEIKRHLLLGRKALTNLVLKSRDITLLTKVHIVKAIVFPVVMYGCENWTIKKAEQWRTDAFKLWCWRRLLRVLWTTRRSNQSVIGSTNAEAEAPILWPRDAKSWLIGKDPYAGKHWRQKEKGVSEDKMVKWHHWFNGHEFEQTPGDSGGQGSLVCCSPWGHKAEHDWVTEQQCIKYIIKVLLYRTGNYTQYLQ